MNIVTPIPTNIPFNTANVNTEAARRDNVQRETVPQTTELENSAAETGLGSESDKVKTPGRPAAPVTYERVANNQLQNAAGNPLGQQDQDNAEDPSAGREDAEQRQQEQAEQREIEALKQRDQEVRTHEQAHASVGGQYAGAPSYEYETGPDGKRYATSGEVSIDISKEGSPEETLRKMEQVKAAALAPAEPSPQDLRVASEATQRAAEARTELSEQTRRELENDRARQSGELSPSEEMAPELDDIVRGSGSGGSPTRSLKESDPVAEAAGLESPEAVDLASSRDPAMSQRQSIIEGFYAGVSSPRPEGLQISA